MTSNSSPFSSHSRSTSGSAQTNGSDTSHQGPKQGASLDELGRRFSAAAGDQDIARVIAENWQKFFGALVLILLGVWVFGQYKAAAEEKRAAASELFAAAQMEFDQMLSADGASAEGQGNEASLEAFNDKLNLLASNDADSIYPRLAPLYMAQAAIQEGKLDLARQHLQSVNIAEPDNIPSGRTVLDRRQFIGELAALLQARILVLDENVERAETVRYVRNLAERARFVNSEALLVLYRTAQTEDERNEAKALAAEIMVARPEIAEAIRAEFAGLGASIS